MVSNGQQAEAPPGSIPIQEGHMIQALMNKVQQLTVENTMQAALITQLQEQLNALGTAIMASKPQEEGVSG